MVQSHLLAMSFTPHLPVSFGRDTKSYNIMFVIMVATGQGKVTKIHGQGKVREFCAGSGKFEILRKVREIQENPLKVREI